MKNTKLKNLIVLAEDLSSSEEEASLADYDKVHKAILAKLAQMTADVKHNRVIFQSRPSWDIVDDLSAFLKKLNSIHGWR